VFVSKESGKRGFNIPLDILAEAKRQDISLEQLQDMVMHSTRVTHPDGNRRYHDYLFMVEGSRVVAFGKIHEVPVKKKEIPQLPKVAPQIDVMTGEEYYKCEQCKDAGVVRTFDECVECDGSGCEYCDQGLVPSTIPCPVCSGKKA